jgi:hypothetical protein
MAALAFHQSPDFGTLQLRNVPKSGDVYEIKFNSGPVITHRPTPSVRRVARG